MRIKKNINLGIVDNIHKKKLCASDWLKMSAFSCNTVAKL